MGRDVRDDHDVPFLPPFSYTQVAGKGCSKQTAIRIIVGVILCLSALGARLLPGERTIDDAYITFRYARNLIAGEGFVFNPGEQVLGTTTPLYTLLMAGLGLFSGRENAPFPTLSIGVNALADTCTCLLLWRMGRRLKAEPAGLSAAILWAIAPFSVTFAIGGLETSLYVFLLTACVQANTEKKLNLAALCGSLALLTRPDALLLVAPLALERLWRALRHNERLHTGEFLFLLLPLATWGIFATGYFGSPFPHSVQAKMAAYLLEPASAFIRILQHYATPFVAQHLFGNGIIVVGLFLYPFLFALGARHTWQTEKNLLVYCLYPWIYLLAFSIPNPLIFRWYLTPPLPAYFLFILIGAEQLIGPVSTRIGLPPAIKRGGLAFFLLILPLATTLSAWTIKPDHGPNRPCPEMAWIKLELLYKEAAKMLTPYLQTGQVLAAGDVGVLGYYAPVDILDTVGLNSPQTLPYYPLDPSLYSINYAIPTNLILNEEPDWLVILEIYGRKTLLQDTAFLSRYDRWKSLSTDVYGSKDLLIFRKK